MRCALAAALAPAHRLYKGGLYTANVQLPANHAMVLEGWSTSATGPNWWLVRNSWGPDW